MSMPYAEVIGDPIAQSKSPAIHGFWLEELGLPFPGSIEEFLLDRFSTKLEDPRTGRKIIYPG